ncbi:hypothetical protein ACIBCT_20735 [Streptosporangium sp. NPDC050855]|uniref:hypothetical protein n=1 Tax=Streptosporangium sp. NPDC050855 TaxID=3366194 RepID=UPI00378B78D3
MTTTDLERESLLKLMEPFNADQIGLLPRVTCSDCSDKNKNCTKAGHVKQKCEICKAYVSTKHIHIDYVGHADVTARLLKVDPYWSWEPFALDETGLPALDTDKYGNPVGMWIRLTVCGVTRPGYGSVPSNQHDAVKVLIGDALRNAAQRFGVALAQWQKGDRDNPAAENPVADPGQRAAPKHQAAQAQIVVDTDWVDVFEKRLAESSLDTVAGFRRDVTEAMQTRRINSETANRLMTLVQERQKILNGPADGLPRNQDGTIARRQVTDEQLAEVGTMTGSEKSAHNKLVKDVTSNPQIAERGPLPEDPWVKGGSA